MDATVAPRAPIARQPQRPLVLLAVALTMGGVALLIWAGYGDRPSEMSQMSGMDHTAMRGMSHEVSPGT